MHRNTQPQTRAADEVSTVVSTGQIALASTMPMKPLYAGLITAAAIVGAILICVGCRRYLRARSNSNVGAELSLRFRPVCPVPLTVRGTHSPLSRGIRATGAQGPAAGGREAARRVLGGLAARPRASLAVSDLRRYSRHQARRDRRGAGDRSLVRPS